MRALVGSIVLTVALAACGDAPLPENVAVPVEVASVDGPFQLTLRLPRSVFRADEPITGEMRLAVLDGLRRELGGSGGGVLATSFLEVGGTRQMAAGWDAACAQYELRPDEPMSGPLSKSGGWSGDDPNAAFYEAFFAADDIRLPPGTWDVIAHASFSDGPCGGPAHELTATARILVQP